MGTLSEMVEQLNRAGRLALDTCIFIYAFERHPHYGAQARAVFRTLETGACQGYASVLALGEILTGVKKMANTDLLLLYRDALTRFPGLTLMNADVAVMETMADLRAHYGLPTPDAIHLATALVGQAHAFVTNDLRLRQIKELEIIVLSDWDAS